MSRLLAVLLGFALAATLAHAEGWDAQPIDAHEWGVQSFDWQTGTPAGATLPGFMYTETKPGVPAPVDGTRVKDMEPDYGNRDKPILYFYPPGGFNRDIPVGVEMRFAFGHASAWWPQVNLYRTPAQVAQAKPFEGPPDRPSRVNRKIADDERFELVWQRLMLSRELPKGLTLPGKDLPRDHWVDQARNVDSAYVSNGKEVEKYLFYEGKTTETPAIAILPPPRQDSNHYLVNVGDFPIHDVFAIYRDKARNVLWVKYLPVMAPVPIVTIGQDEWPYGRNEPQITALALPDFAAMTPEQGLSPEAFTRMTRDRLVETLSAGVLYDAGWGWFRSLRDPARPQPPTTQSLLFPQEAFALEAIWHADFFAADGLTILYREDPAYLDQAMPLNIYTDMYHFIRLTRCGLVLNRNVPYQQATVVDEALRTYCHQPDDPKQAEHEQLFRQQRFLTRGLLRFYQRQAVFPSWDERSSVRIKALESILNQEGG